MTGIYFHIPFCAKKCPYCDFFSVPYSKCLSEEYVHAILRNIRAYPITDTVDTIYFGGGTPSLLRTQQVAAILEACDKYLSLRHPEITLEYNPSGKRDTYLHDIYHAGVNRLSIGIQSFSDNQLQILGRTHSAAKNLETVLSAYQAGFRNISCDLILAVPHQTREMLAESLQILAKLPITHVSAYLLQIEEHTHFAQNPAILNHLPDDDTAADFYLQTVHTLSEAGFQQYEISSFAKTGFESRHNLKYWNCESYLGIGAGAHSCYQGRRFFVPKDVHAFCQSSVQQETILSKHPCDKEEQIMLKLRTTAGICENLLSPEARTKLPMLIQSGYIYQSSNNLVLTPEGFAVSNRIINLLLS